MSKNKKTGVKKILIAEDEPALAEALSIQLTKSGYDVEIAKDGEIAFEKLIKELPDLLILDLIMPKMEGREVIKQLLKENPKAKKDLTVFIMTNLSVEEAGPKENINIDNRHFLQKSDWELKRIVEKVNETLK